MITTYATDGLMENARIQSSAKFVKYTNTLIILSNTHRG